jgi:hypothetical protein
MARGAALWSGIWTERVVGERGMECSGADKRYCSIRLYRPNIRKDQTFIT